MDSNLRSILSEIDLTKSPNSNFPYLSRQNIHNRIYDFEIEDNLPLEPEESKWIIDSDNMSRVFQIDNRKHFLFFLNNIMDHSEKVGHDPAMIIKFPIITIRLKTHDLDEVTELDIEFSKFIDEVYDDILFIDEEF